MIKDTLLLFQMSPVKVISMLSRRYQGLIKVCILAYLVVRLTGWCNRIYRTHPH